MKKTLFALCFVAGFFAQAQMHITMNEYESIENQVIKWRHDFHQNPELSNREFKTAAKIAAHLKSL